MNTEKTRLWKKLTQRRWLKVSLVLVLLFSAIYLSFQYLFSENYVTGLSMVPTFLSDDKVLTVRQRNVKRGDIVILKAPDAKDQLYIKRVIGLPGDTITSNDNKLYINGKRYYEKFLDEGKTLKEPSDSVYGDLPYTYTYSFNIRSLAQTEDWQRVYSKTTLKKFQKTNRIPANSYFVMGDHRVVSKDSRILGFIQKKAIVGRVFVRYWPFERFTWY